jgi:hypothetical protein
MFVQFKQQLRRWNGTVGSFFFGNGEDTIPTTTELNVSTCDIIKEMHCFHRFTDSPVNWLNFAEFTANC